MEEVYALIGSTYLFLIPFLVNQAFWEREDIKQSFIKWFFSKSKYLNWLGWVVYIVICSGVFFWLFLFLIATAFYYIVFLPVIWVVEFIFFNKDCSDLNRRDK